MNGRIHSLQRFCGFYSTQDHSKMSSLAAKRDVKKGLSADDSRRRREENSVKLRKEKKEEGLAKRRNIQAFLEAEASPEVSTTPLTSTEQAVNATATPRPSSDPETMAKLYHELLHGEISVQVQALRSFRRLLSIEKNPPVQQCVDLGVVPIFVQCLQRVDSQELQFEAAWALTNIASTDRTRLVVENNAVPPLIALLSSANPDIREQSAWCLGNIAGDSTELRDYLLQQGALPPLLANIAQPHSLSLLRNCTWSLSNFCRGKPQPKLEVIRPALPILGQLINSQVDQDTMIDAAWAISYITDGNDERIQPIIDLGVLPTLVKMMASGINTMIVPALRAIGNMVSGNDIQTQAVLDAQTLQALVPLLSHNKKNIRKETCWVLSNIAAGTPSQLNSLFLVPELLSLVVRQLSVGEWDVRREACWVISNIATSGTQIHLKHLVEIGVLKPLIELLGVGEVKIILITLDAIEAILKTGNEEGDHMIQLMDEVGGIDALEKLQEHENEKVYNRSITILTSYFGEVEEDCSENIAPTNDGNTYSFGMTSNTGKANFDFGGKSGSQQQAIQPANTHIYF